MVKSKEALMLFLIVLLEMGTGPVAMAQQTVLNRPVTISFERLKADSALHLLEKATGFNFTYNTRFLPQHSVINARFNAVPFSVILDSIFANPLLNYKILGHQVVVVLPGKKSTGSNLYYRYKGRVAGVGTGSPLPYATVAVLHDGYGVITNKEGYFSLQIPADYLKDTLTVSSLGYYPVKVPVSELDSFTAFRLHRKIVSLPEILIRSIPATELIKKAIRRIPSNDYLKAFTFTGFYREEIKKNRKYMSYTEALLQIYKKPQRPTLYRNQVKVLKMRKYTNITANDTVLFKLQGGLHAVLALDLVRNRPDFLRTDRMDRFIYSLQNMTVLDNKLLYVVSFAPRNESVVPAVSGTLYIEVSSLAIVRVKFHYNRKSLRKNKVQYVLKSRGNVHAFPVWAEYQVSYQLFQGKYYVHYVLGKIRFKVKRKRQWLRSVYDLSFEIMSTDINSSRPERFSPEETLRPGKIFSDQKSGYDATYWKNSNILVPESDIKRALKGFREEIRENNKK